MSGEADLWAALPLPAFKLGKGHVIEAVSPAGEQFLLSSQKAVLGKSLFEVLRFDSDLEPAFERAQSEGAPLFVSEAHVSTEARGSLPCNLRLARLDEASGQMLLLISQLAGDGPLLETRGPATAARSAIGMGQMLAHEIKNPLAGITGAAQLLSMGLEPEDRELTDLIVAESRRIVTLLTRVEEFGNISPPELGAVNLHDVLDRAKRSASLGVGAQMTIAERYDPSLPAALADGDQLLQVLLNLLKNAADAAGPGGTITLCTRYEHGFRLRTEDGVSRPLPLQIEVRDTGGGVPPQLMESMFEPFVSGKENGTGLGLALTAKIIEAHGGFVSCRREADETVFRICLPVAPQKKEAS